MARSLFAELIWIELPRHQKLRHGRLPNDFCLDKPGACAQADEHLSPVTAVEEATGEILEAGEEQATPGFKVWWSVAGPVAVLGGGPAG